MATNEELKAAREKLETASFNLWLAQKEYARTDVVTVETRLEINAQFEYAMSCMVAALSGVNRLTKPWEKRE